MRLLKKFSMILCVLLLGFIAIKQDITIADAVPTVQKSQVAISVNDADKKLDAYNIGGNNYIKIRDIAFLLSGTEKTFSVEWEQAQQRIVLNSGERYTPVGGELSVGTFKNITSVRPLMSTVLANGQSVSLNAYIIGGNTYFKLVDIGKIMNFRVAWNSSLKKVQIYSSCGYTDKVYNPWEYVSLLGKGIDVDWSKTIDGKKFYNEKTVKDFKEAGVSHVRIRISDKVSPELLSGLDKQISDCLKNGIIPIIAYQADEFKNDTGNKNMQEVVAWWSKIANKYKDYSHLLSFDLLIEATDELNKQPESLNLLFENCVSEIRKTNPNRIIFMSPRLRSDPQYLSELKLPSKHNGHMMAEWHFYASGPSKRNPKKLWTTGTDSEKALIADKIKTAQEWQKSTGLPTWVGAWMPGDYNEENSYTVEEQVVFATYVTKALTDAKIPFAINSDTKFYNRESSNWIEKMKPVFKAIFSTTATKNH